ncbi:hypothetical protein [Natrinema sp. SYSU A 869]|uniref:hypothetical protein n=1 Tax=Natrinema sp. SYSU A 869 TaxID=2871694 RepID=UPI001CA45DD9|nr:hypothetical protein [Natrinema sp. SYSU A 869]
MATTNDEDQSKDTIRDNTTIHDRIARYTGGRDTATEIWPMTETWVISKAGYIRYHKQFRDAKTKYRTDVEIKGASICTRHGPGEFVIHKSSHDELLRQSDPDLPNHYHYVVTRRVDGETAHMIADTTIPVTEMDRLIGLDGEYQWSRYQKSGPVRWAAHIPWTSIPEFSEREEEIRERASAFRIDV